VGGIGAIVHDFISVGGRQLRKQLYMAAVLVSTIIIIINILFITLTCNFIPGMV